MDRTARIPRSALRLQSELLAVAFLACPHLSSCARRNPSISVNESVPTKSSADTSPPSSSQALVPSAPAASNALEAATQFDQPKTDEEQRLIKFAQDYMRRGGSLHPESLSYIVKKSGNNEWSVTVIDMPAINRGERVGDFTLHLRGHGLSYDMLYGTAH